jgi:hypothetical protein
MVAEHEGWPVLSMDAVAQAHNHPSLSAAVAKLQLQNWKGYANLIPAWSLANHVANSVQLRTSPQL